MEIFSKDAASNSDSKRFLEFYLGTESYGVDLLKVKEVITPPETTPIPKAPAYVCGLMNLRGLVLTIVDLRKKLGINPDKENNQTAVIIFDLGERHIGVVVDSIQKVLTINADQIKPIPDSEGPSSNHLLGILQQENKLTIWLDPEALFQGSFTGAKAA